jgi:molybdenum-dependent DNA-binding transcriptional regulator ModE
MVRLDSIDDFRIFDAIARTGSLSGAGRDLSLSLAVISKRLKRIEETLGSSSFSARRDKCHSPKGWSSTTIARSSLKWFRAPWT